MVKFNDKKMINDIRSMALDMIHEAKSGHPGITLGIAPTMYALFSEHLKFDLERPNWCNRDRFVASAGHVSALLYSTLFFTTDEYSLDDLKKFRVIDSCTPGHPLYDINKRIEATTGVLGEGFGMAVGMAMAEKKLEADFNTKKNKVFDYKVYCLVSDGDLMEGISYEAASLAGSLALNNLIILYDSNSVSLDGNIGTEFQNNIIDMYLALNFEVIVIKNGENINEIDKALNTAKKSKKPVLIVVNTVIGKYSKYEGTNRIHSEIDEEDYVNIKVKLGSDSLFAYDSTNTKLYRDNIKLRTMNYYREWYQNYEVYMGNATEAELEKINAVLESENAALQLDKVIDVTKLFLDKPLRDINFQIMNVIGTFVSNFIGGSADVVSSTKTYLKGMGDFDKKGYTGKNIRFGVREHAMGAILNGLALSGYMPFGSTFLTFSDHIKPSIRLSAMMKLPVTYIFTHDSIMVGKDGETHQPIEQLGMLRSVPGLEVYRPSDYKELIGSWNLILQEKTPSCIVLPRGNTESYKHTSIMEVMYGGYVINEVKTRLDLILVASGSELTLAMQIKQELLKSFIEARVVSMPNLNKFIEQPLDYREQVFPLKYKKVIIELSNDSNWYKIMNDKDEIININTYGKSGNEEAILKDKELDITSIIIRIKNSL